MLLSELIALSAMYDGKFCRSFPLFGIARRGGLVTAFASIGKREEMTRSQIYAPDIVVVQDPKLPKIMDVTKGLKEGGIVIQNSSKAPQEVAEPLKVKVRIAKIAVVDAISIGLEVLGHPIPNTAMLGALSKVTGLVTLKSATKAVKKRFPAILTEKNVRALNFGFEKVRVLEFP